MRFFHNSLTFSIKAQQTQDRAQQNGVTEGTGQGTLLDDSGEVFGDFSFDEKTVSVYDDMVSRSVPFYGKCSA